MTSDTIGASYGMLGRFRLPKLAKPRSPRAAFCKRQRNRIAFVVAKTLKYKEINHCSYC